MNTLNIAVDTRNGIDRGRDRQPRTYGCDGADKRQGPFSKFMVTSDDEMPVLGAARRCVVWQRWLNSLPRGSRRAGMQAATSLFSNALRRRSAMQPYSARDLLAVGRVAVGSTDALRPIFILSGLAENFEIYGRSHII